MSAKVVTIPTPVAMLCASLRERGVPFGPTFGDFMDGLHTLALIHGWKPETPFASMEIGIAQYGIGVMSAELDDDGAIVVKEHRS